MQVTFAVVLSGVAAVMAAGVATLAWSRREGASGTALAAFNLSIVVWSGGNALQMAATTEATKLFWVSVQYVGIAALPVSVFAFAAAINGLDRWLRPRRLALLSAPLVALVFLSWTNPGGLVRTTTSVERIGGVVRLERTFGPAFWAGWIYSNLLTVTATVLVLRAVVYAREPFRRRTAALLVGAAVPWLAQFLYLLNVNPIEPEAFFAVTGVAFAYATLRYRTGELRPVARDAVLELLDDGVLVVDERDRIVDCNDAARDLLGGDPLGESIASAFEGRSELLACYREGSERDDLVLESNGEDRHVDVRFATLEPSGIAPSTGSAPRVIFLRDVTQARERERELERQNERLEHVRDALAHDLRNPLNVAAGYLQMARDGDEDALEGIERAHDRIETLVDDVLALAGAGQNLDPEPIDLGNAAREAWASVETDGAELTVEEGTELDADRTKIQQLMENLFANAIEHAGPDVEVRLGRVEESVRSGDADGAGFYVEDDGPGIPEEEHEAVLEHGHSGDGGTGLGLAIVNEIADAHGWGVRVTTSESGGARFEFVPVE